MLLPTLLADLLARRLVSPEQAARLAADEAARPFSLHWELRAALYLGIVTFTGGVGVLIYENLDSLGHGVVVALLTVVVAACFGYAIRRRKPFTWGAVTPPDVPADYILLLGSLSALVLLGYVQYQYGVFGRHYGLATLVPAVALLGVAYRFDHRGVLALALTTLAAWVGVSVTPMSVLRFEFFATAALTWGAIGLGAALLGAGLYADFQRRKPHFAYTYLSLGANVALPALLAALFEVPAPSLPSALAAVLELGLCAGLTWYARRTGSYFFLLLGALYAYITVTYVLFKLFEHTSSDSWFGLLLFYVPGSAAGAVLLIVNLTKLVRPADAANTAGSRQP